MARAIAWLEQRIDLWLRKRDWKAHVKEWSR